MSNRPRLSYYWDTSVFLMVIKGETVHGQEVLDAATEIMRQVERGDATMITSEINIAEGIPKSASGATDTDSLNRFRLWLEHEHVVRRDVDPAISREAADLQLRCRRERVHCPKPCDAIHIATAMAYHDKLVAFHAVDDHFAKVVRPLGLPLLVAKPCLARPSSDPDQPGLPGVEDD